LKEPTCPEWQQKRADQIRSQSNQRFESRINMYEGTDHKFDRPDHQCTDDHDLFGYSF